MRQIEQRKDTTAVSTDALITCLLEIQTPEVIRLVADNEDWQWGGHTWQAFPFEFGSINATGKGEIPRTTIKVSNITGTIKAALDSLEDLAVPVTLRVARKDMAEADITLDFQLSGAAYDEQWVSLDLSPKVSYTRTFPNHAYGKVCPWAFKDWRCRYSGSAVSCDKSEAACAALGNVARFGGFMDEN